MPASKAKAKVASPPRRRLQPAERRQLIIEEATKYFAEEGLASSTEELARRLGVTQPLLFRYFHTKDALIQAVYAEVERKIGSPEWLRLLGDRSRPLHDRLVAFYVDYVERVYSRHQFRLFLQTNLARRIPNVDRYYGLMQRKIYPALARELRAEFVPQRTGRVSKRELEIAHNLHAMMYHMALRRWGFGTPLLEPVPDLVELKVRLFLGGVPAVLRAA